jgi:ATP-dependent Lhr-like helicase
MLDAPMFASRWRWAVGIALAIQRFRGGKKVAPQLQRMDAEDLSAIVFPDHLACFENIQGARQIPDHPLVNQAIADCLHEGMDIAGLERLLGRLEAGEVSVVARDLTEPSPLAHEVLGARPYAFLDDAPAEERRTRMVKARRHLDPTSAAAIGRLDPAAIARVRREAWPEVGHPDELHDALTTLGFMTEAEGCGERGQGDWRPHLDRLAREGRACRLLPDGFPALWVAAERLAQLRAVRPQAEWTPPIAPVGPHARQDWTPEAALRELLRGRLEGLGPVSAAELARPLGLGNEPIEQALLALEAEGFVLRGHFTDPEGAPEWCERRLLARIHRYTVKRLRAEIEPVSAAQFMVFLLRWQGLTEPGEGIEALHRVLCQLEGYEIPASAWEASVLPARLRGYDPAWLDRLCQSGRIVWLRLPPRRSGVTPRRPAPVRSTPLVLLERKNLVHWRRLAAGDGLPGEELTSGTARRVRDVLRGQGALFFDDLLEVTGLLPTQVEAALAELVALGQVSADGFAGLRALLAPASRAHGSGFRARRRRPASVREAGRWTAVRPGAGPESPPSSTMPKASGAAIDDVAVAHIAQVLLTRYGVVFRSLLERESSRLPPWRELAYIYRRMEARGELRGGRFVAGVSGEQYALPEAVAALQSVRRTEAKGELVAISAADPLNLTGLILPGERIPALSGNRVLFRDGVPVAVRVAGQDRFLEAVPRATQWRLQAALLGQEPHPPLRRVE